MRLTRAGEYAIRCISYLSKKGTVICASKRYGATSISSLGKTWQKQNLHNYVVNVFVFLKFQQSILRIREFISGNRLILKGEYMVKQIQRVYLFYLNGFREMTIGRRLWAIISIKLFIMFAILKVFFFPNYLNSKFETDEAKGNHVMDQLIKPAIGETVQ